MNFEVDILRSDDEHSPVHSRKAITEFLFEHLDEFGDNREAIGNCLAYAFGDGPGQSGFAVIAHVDERIMGAAIVNHTNMKGYIPENILVYIAVHREARGQGLGKKLMEAVIAEADGEIALHVESDNPARYLYEKYGFENKYLEMRRTQ